MTQEETMGRVIKPSQMRHLEDLSDSRRHEVGEVVDLYQVTKEGKRVLTKQ